MTGRDAQARPPRLQRDDLGARRVRGGMEIELELALTFGQQRPQDDLERRLSLELGRDVLDRQQIRERVLARGTGRAALMQQSPLFQVAKVILGDGGIETAKIPQAVRPGSAGG